MFAKHIHSFHAEVERARASVGIETYTKLLQHIDGDANKISRVDLEARKAKYSEGIEKTRKVTKSEQSKCAVDVPAEMDGGLKKKHVPKRYDDQIKAEIVCRKVELGKPYHELSMAEKKEILWDNEMQRLVVEGKGRDGIETRDVKYIVPQSSEMRALVERINSA